MSSKTTPLAVAAALLFSSSAWAGGISVHDAYARSSGATATSGAAFMVIMNQGNTDDRLMGVRSDAAKKVQVHTHQEDVDGVMKMLHLKTGALVPAGGTHALERGGDHIMLMQLTRPLQHGNRISLTLLFKNAGEIAVVVPIDLERKPAKHKIKH